MIRNISTPLRYPGGKSIFTDYFKSYIKANSLKQTIYAEPYCGGAGAAIKLLLEGNVEKIFLNDANFSIYAFWYSLKYHGQEFLELFDTTKVTLEEWRKQKLILIDRIDASNKNFLKYGFATFFLNRCNRSGILTAGPIGGQLDEVQKTANYKIDARYNKEILRKKLEKIIAQTSKIEVYNLDALSFLKNQVEQQSLEDQLVTFVYLDPPYYNQGSSLYLNYYKPEDHKTLSCYLSRDSHFKWLLSYDNVSSIRNLYKDFKQYSFYINYSAQHNKLGSELLIASNNSVLPESKIIKRMKNNKAIELTPI